MSQPLEGIVRQIESLSPRQRRNLLRHLKASGLLEPEELLSDRNPLTIAPAVQQARAAQSVQPPPARPSTSAPVADPANPNEPYRSPVRGHVVVGSPGAEEAAQPSVMPPLPGQAPEKPIRIIFDGGSRGNPGQGYGSYALDWPGQPRQIVQLNFGDRVTNNEAEYDTLIAGLEAVRKRLLDHQADPKSASLSIWGDSQLVLNQIRGDWKCNEPRLQVRLKKARALLSAFGRATLNYHPREKNVEILGH